MKEEEQIVFKPRTLETNKSNVLKCTFFNVKGKLIKLKQNIQSKNFFIAI